MTVEEYRGLFENTSEKMKFLRSQYRETKEIDMINNDKCPNCGSTQPKTKIPSESWTSSVYCHHCNSLYFIIWADRMGGNYTDTVKIYNDGE